MLVGYPRRCVLEPEVEVLLGERQAIPYLPIRFLRCR